MKRNIVIVGATSTIAEHCARLWTQDGPIALTLVGRNVDRMERVAADLLTRSPGSDIRLLAADFRDPATIRETVDDIAARGSIDIALIAHGSLPEQVDCQDDLVACRNALEINGVSPVLFAEAFAGHMARVNRGTLALIGSVAGDRGRRSNYVYGSAKALVTRYAEGLQHRFAGSGVRIVLVKPGPTDTPMTAHLKEQGMSLAPVETVARQIVEAMEQGKPVVYTPGKWALIMGIVRHIPAFAFNRLNI